MSPELSSIFLVVGFFVLGIVSPGPNFLVVAERSMAFGFRAGFATGLGVATGDALYAAAGLLGLVTVVAQAGWLFAAVKVLGGFYLAWIGLRMIRRPHGAATVRLSIEDAPPDIGRCFRAGFLTDLSNPKTMVFFASIFAMAYDPALPRWVAGGMWLGIVGSSVAWRAGLAVTFSRESIRAAYGQFRRAIEILFGTLLIAFGLRLAVHAQR